MAQLNLGIVASSETLIFEIESTLEQDIRKGQLTDEKIADYKKLIKMGKVPEFREDEQGTVWFKNRICVLEIKELRETILKDVAAHVALCDTCQRVKAKYQRPAGLLQPLKVPEWKWEKIGMDFIVGLPRTRDGYDSIWVIVDRLTEGPKRRTREGGSEWEPIKILLEGDGNSNKTNTASNTRLRLTTQVGQVHTATEVLLDLGTNKQPSEPKHTNTHSGNLHDLLPVLHRSDRWHAPVRPMACAGQTGGQSWSGRWL
jgi:hypothetical protein